MIAIVLLGLLACASASPRHSGHHHRHHHYHHHVDSYYEDGSNMDNMDLARIIRSQMFDTRRLWSELNSKILRLDAMLADLSKRYPKNEPTVQISDKEYKITLQLQSFDEKEVIVKAKKGLLVVQAVRKVAGETKLNYFRWTLPDNVKENGRWIIENRILKIVFPITQVEEEIPTQTTTADYSYEQIRNNEQDNDLNEDVFEISDVDYIYKKDLARNEILHQDISVKPISYDYHY